MHKYQKFSIDSAAAVGSLVVRALDWWSWGLGFEPPRLTHFYFIFSFKKFQVWRWWAGSPHESGVIGYDLSIRIVVRFAKNWQIWRNHVTQVWTISYSAVCRSSSCFEQQVAIFSCWRCTWVALVNPKALIQGMFGVSFKRTYVLSLQEVGKFRRKRNALMHVWMTGYRGFYLKLMGCLFRLNYFYNKLPFSDMRPSWSCIKDKVFTWFGQENP